MFEVQKCQWVGVGRIELWLRVSKLSFPERFTGSKNRDFFNLFERLAYLQKWRKELQGANKVKIYERPYRFALYLQQSSTDFHRLLTKAQKPAKSKHLKNSKFIEFRNQWCSTDDWQGKFSIWLKVGGFFESLARFGFESLRGESIEYGNFLGIRGFLNCQVRLDLRKSSVDAELQRGEAVTKSEEVEANRPKLKFHQPGNTEIWNTSEINLVEILLVLEWHFS